MILSKLLPVFSKVVCFPNDGASCEINVFHISHGIFKLPVEMGKISP